MATLGARGHRLAGKLARREPNGRPLVSGRGAGRTLSLAIVAVVMTLNLGTLLVVVLMSFTDSSYPIFPPRGLSVRWYGELSEYLPGISYSLRVSLSVATFSVIIALTCSIVLVRGRVRGKGAILNFLQLPILVPSLILALGVFVVLLRAGWQPGYWPLVLTLTVHTCPIALRVILASLQNLDWQLEAAARTLGASRLRVWYKIIVPLAAPAVITSWALIFILTFDDADISVFLSSPTQTTYGAEILYQVAISSPSVPAAATVVMAISVAFACLVGVLYRVQRRVTRSAHAFRQRSLSESKEQSVSKYRGM